MEKKRSERSDERKKDEAIPQGREECISADVAVIGAGASGMAAAVAAAAQGCSVVIAEGNDRAGKKLYATGNGRCNFTNEECTPESFNRPEDRFVESILNLFGTEETLRFFDSEGMMARLEEGGRYYPYSGQASAVVKTLERAVKRSGCRFLFSDRAVKTGFSENGSSGDGYFRILTESGRRLICRRLIVACGGRAGLKTGSTGDGYGFAKSFGHTLKPPRPALTAAESDAEFLGNLKGVRARGSVSLYEKERISGGGFPKPSGKNRRRNRRDPVYGNGYFRHLCLRSDAVYGRNPSACPEKKEKERERRRKEDRDGAGKDVYHRM